MNKFPIFLFSVFFNSLCFAQKSDKIIFKSDAYSIYADSVVQGNFVAKAISDKQITSTYKSPSKINFAANIKFKFTINGNLIEMKAGTDHHYLVKKDGDETPIIKFGKELKEKSTDKSFLKPDTRLKIRVDMRHVLKAFKNKGFFVTNVKDTIYKKDFKTVYVGGETTPMIWNFEFLYKIPELELKDDDKNGIYETTVNLNPSEIPTWKLSKDISAFPQYKSSYPISNAIYNLSLEEMEIAIEKDSTFRTGLDWPGVWTRDISYSILLSMAYMQPKVAMYSLLKKVNVNNRIIQDTGTGGSYPVSTDRMIWAIAAWEVYKVTGDKNWLNKIYPIIKNSIEDDINNIYDPKTFLARGESSFLDWRDQTYPKWMQPVDIYTSQNLGTNAIHYKAIIVLANIAAELKLIGEEIKFKRFAETKKIAINKHLWLPEKGYYAQFLYGRNYKSISPKAEALGEALAVLFNVANDEKQKIIVANTPVTDFGIPCIYPQIPNIGPYHNNGIWPFVQSYFALASAKAGNEKAVLESISAIYRPAALFLTNKENFVADNGDFSGTAINSNNMLWSLSGNLSLVHRVLFGIDFTLDGLLFQPIVPKALADTRTLNNFKYRNSILNITMMGFGKVRFVLLNNELLKNNLIPTNLTGIHDVKIVLTNEVSKTDSIHKVSNDFSPEIPALTHKNNLLTWNKSKDAINYTVIKNGEKFKETINLELAVQDSIYAEYQIIAHNAKGQSSFASEPLPVFGLQPALIYQLEDGVTKSDLNYKGYTGKGFIEISKTKNTTIKITIKVPSTGVYAIDFKYANGNGELGQSNKAALRNLLVENRGVDTIVFPQRGDNDWNNWGFSNAAKVFLPNKPVVMSLVFHPSNENMNIDVNQAMIDYVRIIKLD